MYGTKLCRHCHVSTYRQCRLGYLLMESIVGKSTQRRGKIQAVWFIFYFFCINPRIHNPIYEEKQKPCRHKSSYRPTILKLVPSLNLGKSSLLMCRVTMLSFLYASLYFFPIHTPNNAAHKRVTTANLHSIFSSCIKVPPPRPGVENPFDVSPSMNNLRSSLLPVPETLLVAVNPPRNGHLLRDRDNSMPLS